MYPCRFRNHCVPSDYYKIHLHRHRHTRQFTSIITNIWSTNTNLTNENTEESTIINAYYKLLSKSSWRYKENKMIMKVLSVKQKLVVSNLVHKYIYLWRVYFSILYVNMQLISYFHVLKNEHENVVLGYIDFCWNLYDRYAQNLTK